ncbi:hypothetical protein V8C26DRAFT_397126 [Trichoderma gracile]
MQVSLVVCRLLLLLCCYCCCYCTCTYMLLPLQQQLLLSFSSPPQPRPRGYFLVWKGGLASPLLFIPLLAENLGEKANLMRTCIACSGNWPLWLPFSKTLNPTSPYRHRPTAAPRCAPSCGCHSAYIRFVRTYCCYLRFLSVCPAWHHGNDHLWMSLTNHTTQR